MHCGSVRSVGSVACVKKVEKRSTFQAAADPSANQIASPIRQTRPLSSLWIITHVDGRAQCEHEVNTRRWGFVLVVTPRACLTYRGLVFAEAASIKSLPLRSRCVDRNTKDDTNNR